MKREILIAVTTLFLASSVAHAGKMYEGHGETVQQAMDNAMRAAVTYSPAKCIGKNWSPNIERDCRKASGSLGGYICRAEGSNHAGSCMSKSDIDKAKELINAFRGFL